MVQRLRWLLPWTMRGGSTALPTCGRAAPATMWPGRSARVRPGTSEISVCMIAEYHLTGSARGPSSLSPVLPEAATTLLLPIKDYVPSVTFEGTRDVRVLDHARTLRVAVWLHQLDMSVRGDGMASETLEASQHCQGPLLDLFLTPMMSNLTFKEVVDHVLYESRCHAQHSLDNLRAHRAHIHEELDDLMKAHGEESDKSS